MNKSPIRVSNESIRDRSVLKINSIIKDTKLSSIIEDNIYNEVVSYAKDKSIEISLDNKHFKRLYRTKIISMYLNIYCKSVKEQ